MKKLIIKTAGICLAIFSASAFADKIVITGEPVLLQKQGETYIVPETYKVQEYQYVDVDGTKRACFLDKRPDLSNLDVVSVNVKIGGQTATWNCYSLDPAFFTIQ